MENVSLFKYQSISSHFPPNIPVYDGSFVYRGRKYFIFDGDRQKYIFHFYTRFFPDLSRFEFTLAEIEHVFGPLREFPVDWETYRSQSLSGRALKSLLSVYGVLDDPTSPYPYVPVDGSDEPLFNLFASMSGYPSHVPISSWYVSSSKRFGFFVSTSSVGSFCLAHVFFSDDLSVSHIIDFQEKLYSKF